MIGVVSPVFRWPPGRSGTAKRLSALANPVSRGLARCHASTENVPRVPGVPEFALTCENRANERGHRQGTGVPAVPALSSSLSLSL